MARSLWLRRGLALLAAGIGLTLAATAQPNAEQQVSAYRALASDCRFAAAADAARAAIPEVRRRFGGSAPEVGFVLYDIANYQFSAGRFAAAVADANAAVAALGGARGPGARETVSAVLLRAQALIETGALDSAQSALDTISADLAAATTADLPLAIDGYRVRWRLAFEQRRDDAHPSWARDVVRLSAGAAPAVRARAQIDLATSLTRIGFLAEAETALAAAAPLLNQSGAGVRAQHAIALADLAVARSEFGQALVLLDKAAAAAPAAGGCGGDLSGTIAARRGGVLMLRRDGAGAGEAFRAALDSFAAAGFDSGSRVAAASLGLAQALRLSGRFGPSAALFDRAAAAADSAYGAASVQRALVESERAAMLVDANQPDRALTAARAGIAMLARRSEALPIERANAQSALGFALRARGDLSGAANAFALTLAGFEQARGLAGADLPPGLIALAELALERSDLTDASRRLTRAEQIQRAGGWTTSAGLGRTLSLLAEVSRRQGDLTNADQRSREAVAIVRERTELGSARLSLDSVSEQRQARAILERDAEIALARLGDARTSSDFNLVSRLFENAQLANATRTALAVAQTAARFSTRNDRLGGLVRERQQALEQFQDYDDLAIGAVTGRGAGPSPGERSAARAEARQAMDRVRTLEARIAAEFPDFAAQTRATPVRLDAVQALLGPDEAVVAFLFAGRASYAVFVRRDGVRLVRSKIGQADLDAALDTMRAELDRGRWDKKKPMPAFDPDPAFAVYRELLAPAEPDLQGVRRLIVVPDGLLMQTPIGALLTAPPRAGEPYEQWAWLARRYAVLTLPSVSSLVALRRFAGASQGARRFFGVGDPLLDSRAAIVNADSGEVRTDTGRIDPARLRRLGRLENTARELSEMADAFGGGAGSLMLGASAREADLKAQAATLRSTRVIAFATHGLVAGDLGLAEPGLVMTPPPAPTAIDDGFLAASEIAELQLDADWVILSACKTGASDGRGDGEGLSGLARAFFTAGARAVFVSLWDVETLSAEQYTQTMARAAAAGQSRADAAQTAALALMQSQRWSHPTYWAAFSVVAAQ